MKCRLPNKFKLTKKRKSAYSRRKPQSCNATNGKRNRENSTQNT